MEGKASELEAVIARHAARQHGNVTRKQLLVGGFTPAMIDRRLRIGALTVMFRGVYLASHGPTPPLARECAAVLACAPQALLDDRTAAGLLGLRPRWLGDIHVTVVGRRLHGQRGIVVREIGSILPGEVRRHEGIPIASPSLTLLNLAGSLTDEDLLNAVVLARGRRLFSDAELAATLRAHSKRRGAGALTRLLAGARGWFAVESEAEALCLRLMLEYDLEPDATQAEIGPYRVDFLYRAERLVVEVDGYRWHGARDRFIRDRRRTTALIAHGYAVFPVTWWDLTDQPSATMWRLRKALAARSDELRLWTPDS